MPQWGWGSAREGEGGSEILLGTEAAKTMDFLCCVRFQESCPMATCFPLLFGFIDNLEHLVMTSEIGLE